MATTAKNMWDFPAILFGMLVVCVICWLVLRGASSVVRFLGENGMTAMSRIAGFLLLCVGIQFIVNGVTGIVLEGAFLKKLIQTYQAVSL
jgi:multiple antibiotic resistance protein